jgi:hypothetical protein
VQGGREVPSFLLGTGWGDSPVVAHTGPACSRGLPKVLVSDRGCHFMNALVREMGYRLVLPHQLTVACAAAHRCSIIYDHQRPHLPPPQAQPSQPELGPNTGILSFYTPCFLRPSAVAQWNAVIGRHNVSRNTAAVLLQSINDAYTYMASSTLNDVVAHAGCSICNLHQQLPRSSKRVPFTAHAQHRQRLACLSSSYLYTWSCFRKVSRAMPQNL